MRGMTQSTWIRAGLLAALVVVFAGGLLLIAGDTEKKSSGELRLETLEPAEPETHLNDASSTAASGAGIVVGQRIFLDPATGLQVEPSPQQRLELQVPAVDMHAGLREERLPDGSFQLQGGNFRQALQVRIGTDGKMHSFHAQQPMDPDDEAKPSEEGGEGGNG